jgi:predicted phage baseplate assembly protein
MLNKTCGCSVATCDCCAGTKKWTPLSTGNRPGLGALRYRVGTHGAFLESMKARLASMSVDAPGADGQTIESFQPLLGLTTRDAGDAAIALLDSWATVGDVLTFYQERIANEGYLRCATERRSILELARLVGYALRPGVASTVYLTYTLDDKQIDPVEIPLGARAQSIPGPGELPQSFETAERVVARREWNNLQVRLRRPQNITLATALATNHIYVAGTSTNLKAGDLLLLRFDDNAGTSVVRKVAKAEGQFADNRIDIQLQPLPPAVLLVLPLLAGFLAEALRLVAKTSQSPEGRMVIRAEEILNDTYLGVLSNPADWPNTIASAADEPFPQLETLFTQFEADVSERVGSLESLGTTAVVTNPSLFVTSLLKESVPQVTGSLHLNRSLGRSALKGSDVQPQLLVNFAPRLKDTYYSAWSSANINEATPALQAVYALRVAAPLFGASVARPPKYYTDTVTTGPNQHKACELMPQKDWDDWPLDLDESNDALFLDRTYEAILPGGFVLIQNQAATSTDPLPYQVIAAQTTSRTAYGISGKTTQLTLDKAWWSAKAIAGATQILDTMASVRSTLVYAQSEELILVEEPITANVQEQNIELAGLYKELVSGRWVILSGERTDIPGVTGVKVSELLMIAGLKHDYDPTLPGDKIHTTLSLATPLAYQYKRDTLAIYGNVVKATHGETRTETLGSGDGSQALQSFALKQPPLTFVPAPTPVGVDSTLKVYVNDVAWHERDTLAGLGRKDRNFVTQTDDDAKTTVIFGNGKQGSRLPTGRENIKAVYRNGIGKGGNVLAEQVSILMTRPLGVKEVINPLRASGGADKESRDQARDNAPLAVMALDRLVSVQDYADFTRTFAGIGKALARRLSDGKRELLHLTIAGADDIPIDPVSDLYRNLLIALRQFGDPGLAIRVDLRELKVLTLSAKVRLAPDYLWEPVATAIRAALLDVFGFQRRALGQPALLSEVISLMQNIDGVAYVDVDAFGGIPEKTADGTDPARPIRRLLTLDEIALTMKAIVNPAYPSLLLRVSDLKDNAVPLVEALIDPSNNLSNYLVPQFSAYTRQLLVEHFRSKGPVTESLKAALIKELNNIIEGECIYQQKRFDGIVLTEATQALLQKNPQGDALVQLNRWLLEDAYPKGIAPSPRQVLPAMPPGPAPSVDVNLADFEKGTLRPAQLAIFSPAVSDTLILNQIT